MVALIAAAIVGGLHGVNLLLEELRAPERATPAGPHANPPPPDLGSRPAVGSPRSTLCPPAETRDGVPRCGVSPPTRRVARGTAYRVTTVDGEMLWVVLPDAPGRGQMVVATPHVPIGWVGRPGESEIHVTSAPPLDVAAGFCGPDGQCDPIALSGKALPNGATLTRWHLGTGAAPGEVVTLQMGIWVLAFREEVPSVTDFVAGLLRWRLEGGFLLLESPDPTYPVYEDWAGVRIDVTGGRASYSLTVTPGCGLSEKRPDVGLADAGSRLRPDRGDPFPGGEWCSGGSYWVEARNVEGASLERLYRGLEILREGPHARFAPQRGPW